MNLETLNQHKAHYDQFRELPVEVVNEMFTIVSSALAPAIVEVEPTLFNETAEFGAVVATENEEEVTTTAAPVKRKTSKQA